MTVDIFKVVSVLVGLWLWGLSMWFFLVSVGSLWKYVRKGSSLPFQMTWWSFVFPNTALVGSQFTMIFNFYTNVVRSPLLRLWARYSTAMPFNYAAVS
jgi:tellurite resistance protein TehA-like permease